MARLRTSKEKFKQTSSSNNLSFSLKVKLDRYEFEGAGPTLVVTQEFHKFLETITQLEGNNPQHPSNIFQQPKPHLNATSHPSIDDSDLQKIFEHDQESPALIFRTPPPTTETVGNLILVILLGHQTLRGTKEVAVTALKQTLLRSEQVVSRVDRALKPYLNERFILKRGRGKGGRYRLTSLGQQKAREKAREFATQLP